MKYDWAVPVGWPRAVPCFTCCASFPPPSGAGGEHWAPWSDMTLAARLSTVSRVSLPLSACFRARQGPFCFVDAVDLISILNLLSSRAVESKRAVSSVVKGVWADWFRFHGWCGLCQARAYVSIVSVLQHDAQATIASWHNGLVFLFFTLEMIRVAFCLCFP